MQLTHKTGLALAILTVAGLSAPTPAQAQQLYFTDFSGTVGPEWSTSATDVTPIGNRHFLGQFANSTATLSLSNLPTHSDLSVSCQLFIIRSWDGAAGNQAAGPDEWSLNVSGGPTLLDTTFANYPGQTQNYPDAISSGITHPMETGASEVNTLGYQFGGQNMDAVYDLTYTFADTSPSLSLNFTGKGLQDVSDESWGITNVQVSVPTPVPEASTTVSFGLMLCLGLGGLVWSARRRKAQSAE